MKTFLLLVLTLAGLVNIQVKACTGGVFTTQASIDNFPLNNPGCTVITTDVTIGGSPNNITNLNGFAAITRIIGSLRIFQNPSLISIDGLAALKSVEFDSSRSILETSGLLYINQNPLLTSLSGLASLERVPELRISYNAGITSLNGLVNLKSVGMLALSGMPITNLAGLPALDSCGYLSVTYNALLTSLDGFPTNIANLIGVELRDNPLLASANVARGVTKLRRLAFNNMPALTNLSDFNQIESIEDIHVGPDPFISFQGLDACTSIGTLYINGPVPGFTGLENVTKIGLLYVGVSQNSPNIYRDFTGLNSVNSIGRLVLVNLKLNSFNGLNALESLGELDFHWLNLKSLSGLDDLAVDSIKAVTLRNNALTECGVKSICNFLSKPTAVSTISYNGTGCSSKEEILNSNACLAAFPVSLISFQARRNSDANQLNWETAVEVNNKGFEIERSTDARTFSLIGFVDGRGDTQIKQSYHFTDLDPPHRAYYRLKQLDWDGSFEYSKIISIDAGRSMVIAYPNPAKDVLHIRNAQANAPVLIKDIHGFPIQESMLMPEKTINTKSFENGVYLISVGNETLKVWVNH